MYIALENVEVFSDSVVIKVLSGVFINYLSTKPLLVLMEAPFMIHRIDSKKSFHVFALSAILFGSQPSQRKSV